jgi:hypothetical protein
MVYVPVELSQGRPEVCADLGHDLFAAVEHLRDEHQVGVQVAGGAATTASIWGLGPR